MSKPSDERYTRRCDFESLAGHLNLTVDACATAESAKLPRFWTKEQDAFKQDWAGERLWINPPWSDIGPWVARAYAERERALSVMLLPARTDQSWWHAWIEPNRERGWGVSTRFLRGRTRFGQPGDPDGLEAGSPFFWCVLVTFGLT